jgi:4-hydroxy-tetrahydrodipicolinate synthase
MFKGNITAIVTPFINGELDLNKFIELIQWQIGEGIHGLTILGSTGEAATISFEERAQLITTAIKTVNKRIPIIVGTGTNDTKSTLKYSKQAEELGADAVLIVAPYYNKPTQEGIYQHFKAISGQINIPIIIYNVPSRTVINITDETIARIATLQNVIGIKDATGDLSRVYSLKTHLQNKDFLLLTGDDLTTFPFMAAGGHGCISVTSNAAPRECSEIMNLCLSGHFAEANNLHQKIFPLHVAMFYETNPSPAKYALSCFGKITDEVRLPLVTLNNDNKNRLQNVLKDLGLLK